VNGCICLFVCLFVRSNLTIGLQYAKHMRALAYLAGVSGTLLTHVVTGILAEVKLCLIYTVLLPKSWFSFCNSAEIQYIFPRPNNTWKL